MSNLVNHLQSINNPFLDLQNMSKELFVPNNNDTTRLAVIDKLSSKVKKGGFVAIGDPFGQIPLKYASCHKPIKTAINKTVLAKTSRFTLVFK